MSIPPRDPSLTLKDDTRGCCSSPRDPSLTLKDDTRGDSAFIAVFAQTKALLCKGSCQRS